MDPSLLISFTVASFLLALMPGPDNIYVLSLSISNGSNQGVSLTSGLVSGVVVHTFLAATGLTLIIYSSDLIFDIVKYAGALYLLYLAYGAFKEEPLKIEAISSDQRSFGSLFRQGVMMNVLNPKVSLFFIALLPQFVTETGWSPLIQMSILGLVFMTSAFITFSSIALIAGKLSSMVSNRQFWIVTKWIKVMVLVILAITLAISSK